ncbi:replicative DNA helicase [Rhizorhabdus sp.]|uniref:replicative DNA helicase n=1 Tax=Rhizorhabdus sp. TaxID=1968843 RepID=UPI0035B031BD
MNQHLHVVGSDMPVPLVNPEAESALLGALMFDNQWIPAVSDRVAVDDFYFGINRKIFSVMLKLHERGRVASPVTLRPLLEFDPEIAELLPNMSIGHYLVQSTGSGIAVIAAMELAEQVASLSAARKIDEVLGKYKTLLPTLSHEPIEDIVDQIEGDISAALPGLAIGTSKSLSGMCRKVLERNERIALDLGKAGVGNKLVPEVDKLIGPSEGSQYTIIGARTGQGKSTTARSLALGYALSGTAVDYYYTEMSEEQMAIATVSDALLHLGTPIEMNTLRKGNLTSAQIAAVERAEQMLQSLPISFEKVGRCDVRRIEARAARKAARLAKKGQRLGMVFVDYLQHLQATRNGRPIHDATERVATVSGRLLDLAHRLDTHVFALCQLNRGVEDAKDPRPGIHHLKQAGELEQDADSILLLFREEEYLKLQQPKGSGPEYERKYDQWRIDFEAVRDKIELITGKNRHGEKSTRVVRFLGKHGGIRGSDFNEYATAENNSFDFGRTA